MKYTIELVGKTPLIMHNGATGLDTRSPENIEKTEISRKKGSNRTEADDARLRELECQMSLWTDNEGRPTIPPGALRATIETGAKKLKQGPQVREGLLVERITEFRYDTNLGTNKEELGKTVQFTCGVVVQRNRVLRTRAMFDNWSVEFVVEVDDELCDRPQLMTWLDIAGRRIGLGDWRPEKSGIHGRFEVVSIEEGDPED